MGSSVVKRLLLLAALLAFPVLAAAQEATIAGTITDTTGGVLPGVTVRAVNDATGNSFEAVTDERGAFRVPVRIGNYKVTVELSGFATVNRTAELLVGQIATLNIQMSPSTLQETVTVTGEAPLLDVSSSAIGGNIDPRQVQELPVQGGSWTALALLAPGNRSNAQGAVPIADRNNGESREFQLNMDGQQVSAVLGTGGQPMYSRAAIAEFQFISNRFDATQGRSSGVQVNAVSKSGTNNFAGLVSAQFRDDSLNSKDFFQNRVLPYSNQQYSLTFGGPVLKDRMHFFANYEYEREPRESVWNTIYSGFNVALNGESTRKIGGGRVDYQISPKTRAMFKAHGGQAFTPFATPSAAHPASTNDTLEKSNEYLGQLTSVLGNAAVNEIKIGRAEFSLANKGLASWSNHWQKANGITTGAPRIQFTGFNITPNQNHPRERVQDVWSFRDDFTFSYNLGGAPRCEVRVRMAALSRADGELPSVLGSDRCPRRNPPGKPRRALSGSLQCGHLELECDLVDYAVIHVGTRFVPDRLQSAEVRGLVAGRLADCFAFHVESRRAVRPHAGRVRERLHPGAHHGGRPQGRQQQHPAASGLCVAGE